MPILGRELSVLHSHDNCLTNDEHYIPFTSSIDFESIAKELAENGYNGTLMLKIG